MGDKCKHCEYPALSAIHGNGGIGTHVFEPQPAPAQPGNQQRVIPANAATVDFAYIKRVLEASAAQHSMREEVEQLGKFLKNAWEDSEKWYVAYQEAVAEVIRLKAMLALQDSK